MPYRHAVTAVKVRSSVRLILDTRESRMLCADYGGEWGAAGEVARVREGSSPKDPATVSISPIRESGHGGSKSQLGVKSREEV
jgi:hypothetical protein